MDPLAFVAFTTFFATIGPVDVAAMYAGMTARHEPGHARTMAAKGVLIGSALLMLFAFGGNLALVHLGIGLPALRTAGGILLLLVAIDMVFAKPSGSTSTTKDETDEAMHKADISVFPLATPLIAGPAAMGAAVLLMADAGDDWGRKAVVLGALAANLTLAFVLLMMASWIKKFLGVTGLNVISRVVGVLLAALAVQFMFDGVASSGLLGAGR